MTGSSEGESERFGDFVLLRAIRKGGFGRLSIAYDLKSERVVVLKRQPPGQGADARARFQDEIRVSLGLRHVNLVRAFESGAVGEEPYLALDYIPGQDLDSIVERARRFDQRIPIAIAAGMVAQVCLALEYAHSRPGFVHRDLSPSNVVVAYDGTVRLVDFGLALSESKSSKTLPGLAPGTLGFLAPEQRRGGPVDARADLFSLGAVFYFLLTGLPTFGAGEERASQAELERRLAEQGIELAPALSSMLWRSLQTDPRERFQSAVELRAAITGPLASETEIGAFVEALFPVEKKMAAEERASWERRFGAVGVERTARLALPRGGRAATRGTRRLRSGLAIAACLLCGALVALRRSAPAPQPPPVLVAAPGPVAAPAPPPSSPEPSPAPESHAPPPGATASGSAAPRGTPPPPAQGGSAAPRGTPPPPAQGGSRAAARPARAAELRFVEAEALARAGEVHAARTILGELAQDGRVGPRARLSLAQLDYKAGQYELARANATRAIELGLGSRAYFVRAISELKAGRSAEAERDFKQVLALDPEDEEARAGLLRAQR